MATIVAFTSAKMLHHLMSAEGASDMVTKFIDEVMRLVRVLTHCEQLLKCAHKSKRVLNHIGTIRCLAYEVEDVLETFVVEAALKFQQNDKRCNSKLFRICFGMLLNDSIAIENISSKISKLNPEISKFRLVFPDDESAIESIRGVEELRVENLSVQWPKQMYPRSSKEHFVGMVDDLKKLVSLVVGKREEEEEEDEEQHRVISIQGVAGLGKTTIAREVYYHPRVRGCFEAFAWVSLSQECHINIFLLDILRQLGPGKVKEITEEQLVIDRLKEIQRQKKCLIVFDGVQENDQWQRIHSGLQTEGVDTRILLTTQKENIAHVEFLHKLRQLNEDEGWELLKKYAFPQENGPGFGMFPKLGKEMVGKCEYLPLAISSLGRTLSSKMSFSEWQMVNDDISKYLERDHQNEADDNLFKILDSSYDCLPYYLKQCFLYLGIFREQEYIDAEDLIFLWMAEGMVPSVDEEYKRTLRLRDAVDEGRETTMSDCVDQETETTMADSVDQGRETTMLETAEYYLTKLASIAMQVEVDEFSATRRFKLCLLHSRARELSLYQGEKEDFRLKVVDFTDGKQCMLESSALNDGTRRLVIRFDKPGNLQGHDLVASDSLRSLLFLNSDRKQVVIPLRISDFGKFKLLRVLHFVRCKFEGRKLPNGIDKLVNLWYLGLLYCDLDELPSSISNLRNLHVLYVRVYDTTQITIPNVLSRMMLLRHLRLPHYEDRDQTNKLKLGNLLELETLVGFNCLIHDISELSKLKRLRHLVTHAFNNDSLISIINFVMFHGARVRTNLFIESKCDFTSQQGLAILEEVLMCPNIHALTLSMVLLYKFPDCGRHVYSDLTHLKLIGCKIKEDPMEALGKFLNLQKLCLGCGAFVGREMIIHDKGFLNLKYLEFHSLPNLEEWRVYGGAMRNLFALTIKRCPKLKEIPDGLTSISTLSTLELELTPNALANGREEEYYKKFDFVQSCIIRVLDPFSASQNNSHSEVG